MDYQEHIQMTGLVKRGRNMEDLNKEWKFIKVEILQASGEGMG